MIKLNLLLNNLLNDLTYEVVEKLKYISKLSFNG